MADPPTDPDSSEQTSGDTGTPRWVKVFGIIALAVILLLVILLLVAGPGGHGPGMHTSVGGGVSTDTGGSVSGRR
jgi:hypothetical protein